MKAKTRSRKLAIKRLIGRPRKQGVPRTPEGRISRSNEAQEMGMKLMLEAATWRRRRIDPSLSVEDARKQEHGSVIHAWKAASDKASKRSPDKAHDQFTAAHLHTAERIHELYAGYRAAIASRNPRSSTDFSGAGGYDGTDPFEADRQKRDARSIEAWKQVRRAILQSGPLGMMAVESIIFENQPIDKLRGDLRLALNEVERVWRMERVA